MSTAGLTDEQAEIVAAVRTFVDKDVVPVASELEHADEFPSQLVETMKGMGLFGSTIPEEYGGLPERYYRDAPLLLIGEGSNEIQQLIIAQRLLERDEG